MNMLSLDEAARLVGVASNRLAAWVACGEGPAAVSVAGELVFDAEDVRGWFRGLLCVDGVPQLPDCPGPRVLH